jgi:ADP-ribose pyrophosphatase YjhB (NUDIX family)
MDGDARFTVGVAGVVMNARGDVLLIKTAQAGWELPGGRVERGEDLVGALKREVREECLCDVDVGRLAALASNTETSGLIQFTFVCTHASGEPRPGDDSLDAGWFPPEVALRMVTHVAERARLQDALVQAGGVTYRVYGVAGATVEEKARRDL